MFGDIGKMLKLASQMKTKVPQMREELAAARFTACAGDGAVAATVDGQMRVVDVKISQEAVAPPADADRLGELIAEAVSAAQDQAADAAAAAMKELTGGVELPGMEGLMG